MTSNYQNKKVVSLSGRSKGFKAITPEIIHRCQQDDTDAKETFFLHLTPAIAKMITSEIFESASGEVEYEILQSDIFQGVFENITVQGKLKEYDPNNSLRAWLKTVVHSRTIDCLRKMNVRRQGAAQTEGKGNTISIDQEDENDTSLHERIEDPSTRIAEEDLDDMGKQKEDPYPPTITHPTFENNRVPDFSGHEWESLREKLIQLSEEELWLIRLKVIYDNQLIYPEDMKALATYSNQNFDIICQRIKEINNKLDDKREENNNAENNSGLLATQVRKLQKQLNDDNSSSQMSANERAEIEKSIHTKQSTIRRHQRMMKRQLAPTTKEIAQLIGTIKTTDSAHQIKQEVGRLNTRSCRLEEKLYDHKQKKKR